MPQSAPTTELRRNLEALLYLRTAAEEVDGGVLVPALLFTEGDFIDATGKPGKYSRTDLNRIVRATKKYYGNGDDIPIFESNHDLDGGYSNNNKIGKLAIDEGLTVEEITEDNLPDPRLTDLIGRYGIFGHGLITRTDAVERYGQHLIKPLSIAFDPSGEWTGGNKWAIFEVSAVPWGAVRGAMFFAKMLPQSAARYALTLDGAMAERKAMWDDPMDERTGDVLMNFNSVLSAIRNTTEDELQGRSREGLTRQAIEDLSTKLTEILGVAAEELPVVTLSKPLGAAVYGTALIETSPGKFVEEKVIMATEDTAPKPDTTPTPDEAPKGETVDLASLMKRLEKLEGENLELKQQSEADKEVVQHLKAEAESLRFQRKVSDRVQRLHSWAQKLVQVGKVTPAAFKEWFPEAEANADAVARFSKAIEAEDSEGDPLNDIEAALKYADKFAEPVRFGSAMAQQAIGGHPDANGEPEQTDAEKAQIDSVVKAAKRNRYY